MKNYLEFKNNKIYHIGDFERLYSGHFFDRKTMSFWKSRISSESRIVGDSLLFITSEKTPYEPRGYTIRRGYVGAAGYLTVETFGEFQEHTTLEDAKKAMKHAFQ